MLVSNLIKNLYDRIISISINVNTFFENHYPSLISSFFPVLISTNEMEPAKIDRYMRGQ